jgi:glutathione S-transferase
MRTLYHLLLCPFSRKVRVVLGEKKIDHQLVLERTTDHRADFLALNPAAEVPVLVEPDGAALAESSAITEYLNELSPEPDLLGAPPLQRAEVRRIVGWFDSKFNQDVTRNLVFEKVLKRHLGYGEPDSRAIRAGYSNVHGHLEYIAWLTERRTWLAGDSFSLADIAAGAHLSCVDYLGDVPWDEHPGAKDWYARVKSRPSFRPLLQDSMPGAPPPRHYSDLDF